MSVESGGQKSRLKEREKIAVTNDIVGVGWARGRNRGECTHDQIVTTVRKDGEIQVNICLQDRIPISDMMG